MVYCYVEQWRTIEILSNFEGSNRVKLLINKKKVYYYLPGSVLCSVLCVS